MIRQLGRPGDVSEMRMSLYRNTILRTCMEMCVAWAVAQNIMCMMTVSMDTLPSGQAGFQISNTVWCFSYTWPTSLPDFAVPKSFVKRKLHKMYPANTDALKTANSEEYSRNQYGGAVTCYSKFPLQFQDCCEWHHGHIQNVILK